MEKLEYNKVSFRKMCHRERKKGRIVFMKNGKQIVYVLLGSAMILLSIGLIFMKKPEHTSKGTVFTYRSKLRHNASCPPEEFENKICEIN